MPVNIYKGNSIMPTSSLAPNVIFLKIPLFGRKLADYNRCA